MHYYQSSESLFKQTLFFETVEVIFSDEWDSSKFKTFCILDTRVELNSFTESCWSTCNAIFIESTTIWWAFSHLNYFFSTCSDESSLMSHSIWWKLTWRLSWIKIIFNAGTSFGAISIHVGLTNSKFNTIVKGARWKAFWIFNTVVTRSHMSSITETTWN